MEQGKDILLREKPKTLAQYFLRDCQLWPGEVEMREKDKGIWHGFTWGQVYQRVKYFSLGLLSLGLRPGMWSAFWEIMNLRPIGRCSVFGVRMG